MNRFKGTKGEFHAVNYAGAYLIQIGQMYEDLDVLNENEVGEEEAKANAQLISTAPELLEALIDLHRFRKDNNVGAELELSELAINKALGL